jgi:hypothetical protein
MAEVFSLYHKYIKDGEQEFKQIGIYSSRSRALEAILRLKGAAGFRDHPDGFNIDKITLDRDNWLDGFVTVQPGET